ncbi:hypothetical protein F5X68DRAFT_49358 [Plectosphaerella plurivora]|uniref:Uncharacterized protein n=1 Tax=Plectosphaerella plurivora TaxID=936078 RepID=A0A9P8VK15_9PEZI|nr:hypothetical protein F5X68DRAFT_49358 [Plectosphaerella plurivora]
MPSSETKSCRLAASSGVELSRRQRSCMVACQQPQAMSSLRRFIGFRGVCRDPSSFIARIARRPGVLRRACPGFAAREIRYGSVLAAVSPIAPGVLLNVLEVLRAWGASVEIRQSRRGLPPARMGPRIGWFIGYGYSRRESSIVVQGPSIRAGSFLGFRAYPAPTPTPTAMRMTVMPPPSQIQKSFLRMPQMGRSESGRLVPISRRCFASMTRVMREVDVYREHHGLSGLAVWRGE